MQQQDQRQKINPPNLADAKLSIKILDLLQQALNYKQLRKGANEVMKRSLNKGTTELVVLARDCDPIEIVMNIPNMCEEKNVHFCFVESQAAIGRACGIKRQIVAAAIVFSEGSQLNSQIMEVKDLIDQINI